MKLNIYQTLSHLKKYMKDFIDGLSVRKKTLIAPVFSSVAIFLLGILFYFGMTKQHDLMGDINTRYHIYKQSIDILFKIKSSHSNLYKGFIWKSTGYDIKLVKKIFKDQFESLEKVSHLINNIINSNILMEDEKKSFIRINNHFNEYRKRAKLSVESVFVNDITAASMIMQMADDQYSLLYKNLNEVMLIQSEITSNSYKKSTNNMHFFIIMLITFILLTFVLTIILSIIMSGYIEKPIKNIITFLTKNSVQDTQKAESTEPLSNDSQEIFQKINVVSKDEIGTFAKYFSEFISEINKTNAQKVAFLSELESTNKQLTNTLDTLKTTQSELVQKEKMAALGILIAGIAHEINTPLGAIGAANSNISSSIETLLNELPVLFKLKQDDFVIFFQLISKSSEKRMEASAKEERKIRRKLLSELEDSSISDAEDIADTLVDMKIYDNPMDFAPLFSKDKLDILELAYNIVNMKKNSSTIGIAISRASKIVFALKKFAHHDMTGEMLMSDLNADIETILTLYHNQLKQGVEVIKNFEQLPEVSCYPDELNQVWTNLIHNALQAMQYKGILKIETKKIKDQIFVSFTDNGCGIPKDILAKIFDPFFTTKPAGEGSGLGLDICMKIVKKHKGKIDVESESGKTTFNVILPLRNQKIKKNT